MSDVFTATCPNCGGSKSVPVEHLGKTVTCSCGKAFRLQEPPGVAEQLIAATRGILVDAIGWLSLAGILLSSMFPWFSVSVIGISSSDGLLVMLFAIIAIVLLWFDISAAKMLCSALGTGCVAMCFGLIVNLAYLWITLAAKSTTNMEKVMGAVFRPSPTLAFAVLAICGYACGRVYFSDGRDKSTMRAVNTWTFHIVLALYVLSLGYRVWQGSDVSHDK